LRYTEIFIAAMTRNGRIGLFFLEMVNEVFQRNGRAALLGGIYDLMDLMDGIEDVLHSVKGTGQVVAALRSLNVVNALLHRQVLSIELRRKQLNDGVLSDVVDWAVGEDVLNRLRLGSWSSCCPNSRSCSCGSSRCFSGDGITDDAVSFIVGDVVDRVLAAIGGYESMQIKVMLNRCNALSWLITTVLLGHFFF